MKGRFARYVSKAHSTPTALPLAHTTDGYALRSIAADSALNVSDCPHFKEPLLYAFYGRPAYRPAFPSKPTSLNACSLISFLIDAKSAPPTKRIFPFDSGAMKRGLYAEHMHPGMVVEDFDLGSDWSIARRLAKTFFGSNSSYYRGNCVQGKKFPVFEFEAQSYHSLIRTIAKSDPDDRRGTIELQFGVPFDLSPKNVIATIMPEDFYDDPEVYDFAVSYLGAEPLGYVSYHAQPSQDASTILEVARKFLEKKGLL